MKEHTGLAMHRSRRDSAGHTPSEIRTSTLSSWFSSDPSNARDLFLRSHLGTHKLVNKFRMMSVSWLCELTLFRGDCRSHAHILAHSGRSSQLRLDAWLEEAGAACSASAEKRDCPGSDRMTDMLRALKQALAAMLTFWVGANITILLGL